jgi:3',5'-cyclic AMP phosphodiesterase CpdA
MARFLQLSDLHVVAPGTLASGRLDTPALLRKAVDALLLRLPAIGPVDAVIVTGDISDDGTTASYDRARAELDRLGLPLLPVPGNHDTREGFRHCFGDLSFIPETGLIDWAQDIGDTRVIGLDTLIEGQGGGLLRRESLDLLAQALDGAEGRPVLVALHHPPLRTGIRFMDAIALENPEDLARTLTRRADPLRIVAGHVHGVFHGHLGRHSVCTGPSLCSAFALDRRADASVGFMSGPTGCAVVDTAPGGVWAEVPLDHGDGPFRF